MIGNFKNINTISIVVYISIIIFITFGLVYSEIVAGVYISMLAMVTLYVIWLMSSLSLIRKHINIKLKNFNIVSLLSIIFFIATWGILFYKENYHIPGDSVLYDFEALTILLFYIGFLYINFVFSKSLVNCENIKRNRNKSFIGLFLILIVFPFLSYPVIEIKIRKLESRDGERP